MNSMAYADHSYQPLSQLPLPSPSSMYRPDWPPRDILHPGRLSGSSISGHLPVGGQHIMQARTSLFCIHHHLLATYGRHGPSLDDTKQAGKARPRLKPKLVWPRHLRGRICPCPALT
mmetsp:Transcript_6664/g.14716  ORF Transcript_6664/g.14716 Transcript_6664/m.14716 type:complete len:117 (+) Transcript_6664:411-761(+)